MGSEPWYSRMANFWFPRGINCISCGEDLFDAPYSLCQDCLEALGLIKGKTCRRCGRPLVEVSTTLCYACFGKRTSFKGNAAVTAYTPLAQQMIFRFKYKDQRHLAHTIAEMMDDLLRATWISDVDSVVGVPTSPKRLRQRGYCQMALVAEQLSRRSGLEHLKGVLVRILETPRMKTLSRNSRKEALEGCFEVIGHSLSGRSVLLIDDIMTTGATLEVCSQVLLEAGASEVWALTFATVYDNQPAAKKKWPFNLKSFKAL